MQQRLFGEEMHQSTEPTMRASDGQIRLETLAAEEPYAQPTCVTEVMQMCELGQLYPSAQPPLLFEDGNDKPAAKFELDAILRDLREVLHRRARLSARNEALEELCKLLFTHIVRLKDGGITRATVFGVAGAESHHAVALKRYVRDAYCAHLPPGLAHEFHLEDFELRIKPQEHRLAVEIVDCFERLALGRQFVEASGIRTVDLLNDVFGRFLANSFAEEKEFGQYLTPTEVVHFLVDIALKSLSADELAALCDPDKCSTVGLILDPSCGVGSFLRETLRRLYPHVQKEHGRIGAERWLQRMCSDVLVGIDKSERMLKLALTSLAMFGAPAANLHLANSLDRSGRDAQLGTTFERRAIVIMTNPPFGAEFDERDIRHYRIATSWPRRQPRSLESELLFVERYVDWLAPGGHCLAVLPDSILTNKGIYDDLRRNMADLIDLEHVISLPPETFGAAGTNTKTSIVHFRKRESDERSLHRSFFAICDNIGYSIVTRCSQRTKVANGPGDLRKILVAHDNAAGESSIGRWVVDAEKYHRWDATYHAFLPIELERRLRTPSAEDVFVRDVAKLSVERVNPREWQSDTFSYVEIGDVDPLTYTLHPQVVRCIDAPSRARKLIRAGDVLLSTVRPERGTVGIVRDDQDGAVCSTGFAVLRPWGVHPVVLAALLRTEIVRQQLLRNNLGIAYPAVEEDCLLGVLLPIKRSELERLGARADEIRALETRLQAERTALASEFAHAEGTWSSAMG